MGAAGVIECKSDVRLFAAYQGVYHISGIAFNVQGKSVVCYQFPVKRGQVIVQEAVHGCDGEGGRLLAMGNLVRLVPQCQHLGCNTGKFLALGRGKGCLDPAFPLKQFKAKFIFHGTQPGSGRGRGQIEKHGCLY